MTAKDFLPKIMVFVSKSCSGRATFLQESFVSLFLHFCFDPKYTSRINFGSISTVNKLFVFCVFVFFVNPFKLEKNVWSICGFPVEDIRENV